MDNIFGDKHIKVLRFTGDRKQAELEGGIKIYRRDKLKVDGTIYPVAPYDNHFVFRHIFGDRGWTLWCTCGSPAVIAGYDAYKKDASPSGEMILCYFHATTNKHFGGGS